MNRQQIIMECIVERDFRWPRELVSGVMFFKGERITIDEFAEAVNKYKKILTKEGA